MSKVILKKISIVDIDCDCVVNAANTGLRAGGGVCGAIFEAAGYEELTKACSKLAPVKTGSAAITPAFNMKQKFIIHAVGPIWSGGGNGEPLQLKSAYRSALDLAVQNKCASIAFPLISAGIYGYPKAEAWKAALEEVYDFLKDTWGSGIDIDIYFVALDDDILWMGKEEIDRQQGAFDRWCMQMDQAPVLYDDDEDLAGIFENRMDEPARRGSDLMSDPGFLERSMNIPYLDPELLYADTKQEVTEPRSVNDEDDFLSLRYRIPMTIDGVEYSSCNQYVMAKKALAMGDVEYYVLIMHENDPAKIEQLGKEIRNFVSATPWMLQSGKRFAPKGKKRLSGQLIYPQKSRSSRTRSSRCPERRSFSA